MTAVIEDAAVAVQRIQSGQTVMVGGFGGVGSPDVLLEELARTDSRELTCVSTTAGVAEQGLGLIHRQGRLARFIGCFLTRNPEAVSSYRAGDLAVQFLSMGVLAEAIRAGGAGVPAFYTRTSVGTDLAAEKETRSFGGHTYLLEEALKADVALIRAHKADRLGNLVYSGCEKTFGPIMATAADLTIAEVDEIVETSELKPEEITTPHIFVDVLVLRPKNPPSSLEATTRRRSSWSPSEEVIARRVGRELQDGQIVNLGSGIPSLVKNFLGNTSVFLQTENGVLGVGPAPLEGQENYRLTDAMGGLITLESGASISDSSLAFAMINGGHIDVTVLGALEVSQGGDIANWSVPSKGHYGVGGAMDLASGAKRVIAAMAHIGPNGRSKVVKECSLPITAPNAVDVLITDLAVFDFVEGEMMLRELQPGVTLEQLNTATDADFLVPEGRRQES